MTLHVTSSGTGPRLVLLHGWGLNSKVWESVLPRLAQHFTVVTVDLPGHGASPWPPAFCDIDSLADLMEPSLASASLLPPGEEAGARNGLSFNADGCFLLGWSLGAMAALALAVRRPELIKRLILVASTPKFVRGEDWPHGVEEQVLDGFAARMQADVRATVREFLALQVRGDERAQATLRTLRNQVFAEGEPQAAALSAGLDVLRTADLRDRLRHITAPTLVICGERDRLTFPSAGVALAAALPRARFHSIPRAAHAPFISHPEEFCSEVTAFLSVADTDLPHPHFAAQSRQI